MNRSRADAPTERIPRFAGFAKPTGRCRNCGAECAKGRTFCGGTRTAFYFDGSIKVGSGCVHEWCLRTQPAYARRHVFERDGGVCASCGLNTRALAIVCEEVRDAAFAASGATLWGHDDFTRTIAVRSAGIRAPLRAFLLRSLGYRPPASIRDAWSREWWAPSSFWQADHIVPVVEGGADLGLSNLRTLCSPCHVRATAELHRRRAAERAARRSA